MPNVIIRENSFCLRATWPIVYKKASTTVSQNPLSRPLKLRTNGDFSQRTRPGPTDSCSFAEKDYKNQTLSQIQSSSNFGRFLLAHTRHFKIKLRTFLHFIIMYNLRWVGDRQILFEKSRIDCQRSSTAFTHLVIYHGAQSDGSTKNSLRLG